jgi:hypothetical protein
MFFNFYDGAVDIEYFNTYDQAVHRATTMASDEYDMSFTTLEDIRNHTNFLIEQGADGVEDIYIKCDRLKD